VTRADLSPGQQATQACHAFREFLADHIAVEREWHRTSNHLAVLATCDERALADLLERARLRGIRSAVFREPDLGGAITAIALEPSDEARRLCRALPLALTT
jgi:hypothetical protein